VRRLLRSIATGLWLTGVSAAVVSAQTGGLGTTQFSAPAKTTAAWTSATANNTALTVTVTNLSKVIVTLSASSTMTGGSLNFEVDDGSGTWYALPAVRAAGASITRQAESSFALSVVNQAWSVPVGGWTSMRVRLSPAITGTGTANVAILLSASPSDPVVGATLVDTTGTPIAAATDATTNTAAQTTGPQIFGIGSSAAPTAVTSGNSVGFWTDLSGRAHVTGDASMSKLLVTPDGTGSTGSAPPAQAGFVGALASGATGGLLAGITVCDTPKPINISTATTTLLITGVSGRQVRICAVHLVVAGANNVALVEGTGATCGTGTAGMAGGTTAASGWNFAANGGLAMGSGLGMILQTATAGDSVCVVTSAAVQLSGTISYAIY